MKSLLETELNCDFETLDPDQRLNVIRTFAEAYQLVAKHFLTMSFAIQQRTSELAQQTEATANPADIKAMHAQYVETINGYARDLSESFQASNGLLVGVLLLSGFQIDNPIPTVQ